MFVGSPTSRWKYSQNILRVNNTKTPSSPWYFGIDMGAGKSCSFYSILFSFDMGFPDYICPYSASVLFTQSRMEPNWTAQFPDRASWWWEGWIFTEKRTNFRFIENGLLTGHFIFVIAFERLLLISLSLKWLLFEQLCDICITEQSQ